MDIRELIARKKQETEQAKVQLLKTFEFVPDDKLDWSPSETARTPLWIAAHCGATNGAFAAAIRGEELPMPDDPAEAAARIRNSGRDVDSREAAVALIETNTGKVLEALDQVTEDKLGSTTSTPFGPIPYMVWVNLPAAHLAGHAAQLAYLQTIWGDLQDHQ